MKSLFYTIAEYSNIHPIRFWGFILLFVISILFLITTKLRKQKLLSSSENQKKFNNNIWVLITLSFVFLAIFIVVSTFKPHKPKAENLYLSESEFLFGVDISHYQGDINWREFNTSHHPIQYVFVRATMGVDGKDKKYKENWKNAHSNGYLRGAYHYYRPNEDAIKQFQNFSASVNLKSGDFIPILDIEEESNKGVDYMRNGILKWLQLAEEKYGVKPMVYVPRVFYKNYLKGYIDDYPLWVASYSPKFKLAGVDWDFHQFTERVRINGVETLVDGNDFNGDLEKLKKMCIP